MKCKFIRHSCNFHCRGENGKSGEAVHHFRNFSKFFQISICRQILIQNDIARTFLQDQTLSQNQNNFSIENFDNKGHFLILGAQI
jgi:hypothetical protein